MVCNGIPVAFVLLKADQNDSCHLPLFTRKTVSNRIPVEFVFASKRTEMIPVACFFSPVKPSETEFWEGPFWSNSFLSPTLLYPWNHLRWFPKRSVFCSNQTEIDPTSCLFSPVKLKNTTFKNMFRRLYDAASNSNNNVFDGIRCSNSKRFRHFRTFWIL